MSDLTAFIAGMPKCELRLDIEGTLEPEMTFHLARRNRIKLPYRNVRALKAAYDLNDLASFIDIGVQRIDHGVNALEDQHVCRGAFPNF